MRRQSKTTRANSQAVKRRGRSERGARLLFKRVRECPLWVMSGHAGVRRVCPLCATSGHSHPASNSHNLNPWIRPIERLISYRHAYAHYRRTTSLASVQLVSSAPRSESHVASNGSTLYELSFYRYEAGCVPAGRCHAEFQRTPHHRLHVHCLSGAGRDRYLRPHDGMGCFGPQIRTSAGAPQVGLYIGARRRHDRHGLE